MKRWKIAGAVLLLAASIAASRPEDAPKKGLFAKIKTGQSVALKDVGESFLISLMDEPMPGTHEVVEIGDDYIVLKDTAGLAETRIPVYAVKAVVLVRTRPK